MHPTTSRIAFFFFVLVASVFFPTTNAQTAVPTVIAAEMPLYPPLPRAAHIAGTVTLRVVTDGEKVANVSIEDGQPMLAKAAEDNIRTWRFEKHEPTSFLTRFSFNLLLDCDPKNENGNVALNLPLEVTISVPPRASQCDPNWGLDLSEPLKVFLTRCEVDGVSLPCENVSIELDAGDLRAKPEIIRERDNQTVFIIPKELRNAKTFGVVVHTPKGSFSLPELDGSFLKGKWRIVIDHKPFQEEDRYMTKGLACIGFIHFQWSEPERMASSPCEGK